jgi:hypothetical protein
VEILFWERLHYANYYWLKQCLGSLAKLGRKESRARLEGKPVLQPTVRSHRVIRFRCQDSSSKGGDTYPLVPSTAKRLMCHNLEEKGGGLRDLVYIRINIIACYLAVLTNPGVHRGSI